MVWRRKRTKEVNEENARLHKKGSHCPNYGGMCQFIIFRWKAFRSKYEG
jgi:hypothetical protein